LITKEIIEAHISQEDIFRKYISVNFKLGKPFLSELRNEHKGSANVFMSHKYGIPMYKDFGDSGAMDCYKYVMLKFNIDFVSALHKIASDAGVDDNSPLQIRQEKIIVPKITIDNRAQFEWERKPWEDHEVEFWASYGVNEEALLEYEVFPLLWVQQVSEDRVYAIRESDMSNPLFQIIINEGEKYYSPYERRELKWMSNTRSTDIFGLKQALRAAEKGKLDMLGLLAGQKDIMALYSQTGIRSIGMNSESGKLKFTTYLQMKEIAHWLFSLYDNDKTGCKNMAKIEKEYHITPVYLYKFLTYCCLKGSSGIDDVADWYKYMIDHDLKQDKVHLLINYEKEQYYRNNGSGSGQVPDQAQAI
jgi:hypothetical protein